MDELYRLLQIGVMALLVWGAYLSLMGRDRRLRERRRTERAGHGGRRRTDPANDPAASQPPQESAAVVIESPIEQPIARAG
jgi:hypothetical protein